MMIGVDSRFVAKISHTERLDLEKECGTFSAYRKEGSVVFDHLDNAAKFESLGEGFKKAFDFLKGQDLTSLASGKYEIEVSKVFALVQDYTTKPLSEGFWEAHRRYIDLQFVVSGSERIGFGRAASMQLQSHDETRDLSVLNGQGDFATLQQGCFMLLWPSDAHMPGIQVDGPHPVRKIVIKIAAN